MVLNALSHAGLQVTPKCTVANEWGLGWKDGYPVMGAESCSAS